MLSRGQDIQPIVVGQDCTRCHGEVPKCDSVTGVTGVRQSYIAVAVVIFIVIVSIYIVITTRERVTEIMGDRETESRSIYLII